MKAVFRQQPFTQSLEVNTLKIVLSRTFQPGPQSMSSTVLSADEACYGSTRRFLQQPTAQWGHGWKEDRSGHHAMYGPCGQSGCSLHQWLFRICPVLRSRSQDTYCRHRFLSILLSCCAEAMKEEPELFETQKSTDKFLKVGCFIHYSATVRSCCHAVSPSRAAVPIHVLCLEPWHMRNC